MEFQYITPEAQEYSAHVSVYTRIGVINDIIEVLSRADELRSFEESCFGSLLGIDLSGSFSAVLLHSLLAREIVVENAEPLEMWFGIGGKRARFSKYEFCLITGLKFGDISHPTSLADPSGDSIHMRYFKGTSVRNEDLFKCFVSYKNKEFQQVGDGLKLALVMFASLVLLGNDYRLNVPSFLWEMIEDIPRFNAFGWGKYVYHMTYHNLHARDIAPKDPTRQLRYHVYGFPYALLFWAYEAIPEFGNKFAVRKENVRMPRCLNWQFSKKKVNLKDAYKADMDVLEKLEATSDEQQQDYWRGIDDDAIAEGGLAQSLKRNLDSPTITAKPPKKAKIVKSGEKVKKDPLVPPTKLVDESDDESPTPSPPRPRTRSAANEPKPKEKKSMIAKKSLHDVKKIYKELQDLKASNVALTKSNVALEAEIKSLRADIPSMIDKAVERERNTLFEKLCDFFSRGQFGAREGDKRPGTPQTPIFGSTDAIKALAVAASSELDKDHGDHDDAAKSEQHQEPKDDVGGRPVRSKIISQFLRSPYLDVRTMELDKKKTEWQLFANFKKSKQHRYVGTKLHVDARWFKSFESKDTLLDTFHLDAYLALLARRIVLEEDVDVSSGSFCVTDSTFFHHIEQFHQTWEPQPSMGSERPMTQTPTPDYIREYVTGVCPEWGTPWWEVRYVLAVCCIANSHWVTAKIDLHAWTIHIYDSLAFRTEEQRRIDQFACMAEVLPTLLDEAGYWDHVNKVKRLDLFRTIRAPPDDVGAQKDGTSCGVWCLHYADFLIRGQPTGEMNQKDIDNCRKMYSFEIFKNSIPVDEMFDD